MEVFMCKAARQTERRRGRQPKGPTLESNKTPERRIWKKLLVSLQREGLRHPTLQEKRALLPPSLEDQ
jgi:hypothetical protein